jgi:hypothetical protein
MGGAELGRLEVLLAVDALVVARNRQPELAARKASSTPDFSAISRAV